MSHPYVIGTSPLGDALLAASGSKDASCSVAASAIGNAVRSVAAHGSINLLTSACDALATLGRISEGKSPRLILSRAERATIGAFSAACGASGILHVTPATRAGDPRPAGVEDTRPKGKRRASAEEAADAADAAEFAFISTYSAAMAPREVSPRAAPLSVFARLAKLDDADIRAQARADLDAAQHVAAVLAALVESERAKDTARAAKRAESAARAAVERAASAPEVAHA